MEDYEKAAFDFLKLLEKDLVSERYPKIISFSPEKEFIPATLGNIPKELIQYVEGTIHYQEVLFPNKNPFDEEIMALCKNCDNMSKMFELEKRGADFSLKINNGYSYPIAIACGSGQIEAIKYFIEKGYDLNKKYGKNPLFWSAVINKKIQAVNLILENGGKINQKGEFGRTILHLIAGWFAENQDGFDDELMKILSFLIEKGADVNAKDSSKKTPLDLAIMWNNVKYIDYLSGFQPY
ncbi:ankyrin repeat domain-containing protein [Chryseobacterium sp. EO14]|nr:ankyrin repeat domain-containing protein [Chryseobacterium sp. EO14]